MKYWNEYKIGAEHLNNLYSCLNKLLVKKTYLGDMRNNPLVDCLADFDDQPRLEIGEVILLRSFFLYSS